MYAADPVKHDAFESAAIRFAEKENLEQIAMECAIRPQILRNKLNSNQPHQLTVRELMLITKQSENCDLVNSVLLDLDLTAVRLPSKGEGKSPVMAAMAISSHTGDISRHLAEAESTKRLTRHRKNQIVTKAQAAMRELLKT